MLNFIKRKIKRFINNQIDDCVLQNYFNNIRLLYTHYSFNNKGKGVEESDKDEIVVSLTTYGDRINTVHLVIESLLLQTKKPNKIILWLAEEYKDKTLPISLTGKIERGLEIRYCKDLKSYKKLLPALKEFPNSNIITVDDDLIVPNNFVENLWNEHKLYPQDIIFNVGREIVFDRKSNKIGKYQYWNMHGKKDGAKFSYLPMGGAGCLYPPKSLSKEVFNQDAFLSIAPTADDLWFKTMSLINNTKCRQISSGNGFINSFYEKYVPVEKEQTTALHKINLSGANDVQFAKLNEKYMLIDVLKKD